MGTDGAEQAAVDLHFQPRNLQHQAGRVRLLGLAGGIQADTRHQGAVAQLQACQRIAGPGRYLQRRAGHQQAVEQAGAVRRAGNAQAAQYQGRTAAIAGADLHRAVGHHLDVQRLLVTAVVGDLHHAIAGDLGQCSADARLIVRHPHQRAAGWHHGQVGPTFVFATTDVSREAFVPGQLHIGWVRGIAGQGDAPQQRVDGIGAVGRRRMGPAGAVVAQVADADLLAFDRHAVDPQPQARRRVVERCRGVGTHTVVAGQVCFEAPPR